MLTDEKMGELFREFVKESLPTAEMNAKANAVLRQEIQTRRHWLKYNVNRWPESKAGEAAPYHVEDDQPDDEIGA